MKQVFFLLLIGVVIGVLMHSNMFSLSKALHQQIPLIPEIVQNSQNVQGASTSAVRQDFQAIEKDLAKLSKTEIASASPQIKSLIMLLKTLPKSQAKTVCQNVCSNIK